MNSQVDPRNDFTFLARLCDAYPPFYAGELRWMLFGGAACKLILGSHFPRRIKDYDVYSLQNNFADLHLSGWDLGSVDLNGNIAAATSPDSHEKTNIDIWYKYNLGNILPQEADIALYDLDGRVVPAFSPEFQYYSKSFKSFIPRAKDDEDAYALAKFAYLNTAKIEEILSRSSFKRFLPRNIAEDTLFSAEYKEKIAENIWLELFQREPGYSFDAPLRDYAFALYPFDFRAHISLRRIFKFSGENRIEFMAPQEQQFSLLAAFLYTSDVGTDLLYDVQETIYEVVCAERGYFDKIYFVCLCILWGRASRSLDHLQLLKMVSIGLHQKSSPMYLLASCDAFFNTHTD